MAEHIDFACTCGRTLRVAAEKAGERVTCWNCRVDLEVPRVQIGGRVRRESLDLLRGVLQPESFFLVLAGAFGLAVALTIPWVGRVLGLGLLALAGVRYLAIIRRTGLQDRPASWPRPSIREVAGAILGVLVLLAPLLARTSWSGRLPGPGPAEGLMFAGLTIACWFAVPLAALATSATDRSGPISPLAALATAARHPILLGLALLTPIAVLVLVEALVFVLACHQGWFAFMIEDLFPRPASMPPDLDGPWISPPIFNDSDKPRVYLHMYREGLARGYTLFGGLLAGLPLGLESRIDPNAIAIPKSVYLAARLAFATLGLAALGAAFTLQARWLGLLPSIEVRRRPDDGRSNPEAIVLDRIG